MKENQEYVRKKRPINFKMDDLHKAKELEDSSNKKMPKGRGKAKEELTGTA